MSFDRKPGDAVGRARAAAGGSAMAGKRTLTEGLAQPAPPAQPATRGAGSAPEGQAVAAPDVHAAAAHGIQGGGTQLPYLEQIQRSFGAHDVGKIEAHTGASAAEGAGAMGAQAFATGNHVAFAGAPDLHTAAHEAAHVVQQRAGVQLKGGVGEAGDPHERHADAVADLVVQGKSSAALLDAVAGPATAAGTSTPAVQRRPGNGANAGSCDMPFPRTQNDSPNGSTCRRFDGVTTYSMVTEARLAAAGYKFWLSDGTFDKWVKLDGSSELWVQLPKINAATSEKSISQLRSIVATRKAQLDELTTLAKLMSSSDPDVASAAREEWEERINEFPGFDDDYALVPTLRSMVDADHRKAFEDQVKLLVEQRDRYDPQSATP